MLDLSQGHILASSTLYHIHDKYLVRLTSVYIELELVTHINTGIFAPAI